MGAKDSAPGRRQSVRGNKRSGFGGLRPQAGPTTRAPERNASCSAKSNIAKQQSKPATAGPARSRALAKGKENNDWKPVGTKPTRSKPKERPKERLQSPPKPKLADWSAAMESEFENLTGTLDSIKRESLRPAITGALPRFERQPLRQLAAGEAGTHADKPNGVKKDAVAVAQGESEAFEAAGRMESQSLAERAKQLFDDPEFTELCASSLNAQLQRTKDGATDKSRITELAGLVRNVRRALRGLMTRSSAFVDAGVKYEKEAAAQIEGTKLAFESASRQLEADTAVLKRSAAQAAAAHKQAMASWQIELNLQRAETSHAQRELERLQAERDRARSEARRAEEQRAAIEGNVKGMKKEVVQQYRDLQVDHGELVRSLAEAQELHAKQKAELETEIESLKRRNQEATGHSALLEAELFNLKQELCSTGEELAAVSRAKDSLDNECQRLAAGLAAHEQLHREVSAESSSSASQAAALSQQCSVLAQQLAAAEASLASVAREADADRAQAAAELNSALQHAHELQNELHAQLRDSAARDRALQGRIFDLETALAAAQEKAQNTSIRLAQEEAKTHSLMAQVEKAREFEAEAKQANAVDCERIRRLEAAAQVAKEQLDAEISSKQALMAEASSKASRLARIEGEFEAMQEAIGTGSVDQAEMLGRLISRVASLEAAVAESHRGRRELHNQLVNLRGNIRVFCRVKPHALPALTCGTDNVRAEVDGKEQSFGFDRVFPPAASQAEVFAEVSELVQSALDGYQVCLFSYGQTGAGKTHTMQGGRTAEGHGIIPRAVNKILEEASALKEKGWEYKLEATFVEVYNESLRDLLAEGKGRDVGKLSDTNVVKHHPAGGPSTVVGAVRAEVSTPAQAAALVRRAAAARSVEATAMNAASSRSHSVFMLYISGHHAGSSTHLLGGLNLVDLAGSERLDRSLAEGQRQKEACSINKSLSALGDVFSALSARNPHVPYRNSKLTHLLQPCLGGDGKTLMFVNVSPEAESLNETICSLRFAAKVNACQTAARGGARRHVSSANEARGSSCSLQGVKRQSVTAPAAKRKAPAAGPVRSSKPRIG